MSVGIFASTFENWAGQSITVEPFTGSDDYGDAHYGAPVTMKCSLQGRIRSVASARGEERVSNSTLYVIGGPIDPRDRITLPVEYKGHRDSPIINVNNWYDIDGSFSHAEVYL